MEDLNLEILKHKVLFFFMPNHICFCKISRTDAIDVAALKAITPLFYWCSAHEFIDCDFENKFLF